MSRQTVWVGVVLAGWVAPMATMPAQAHHSFPATYNVKETVKIEGTVVAFLFRNPHSFVHVAVKDKSGKTVTWGIEWGGGGVLEGQGVGRDSVKPGDFVVVTGNPARDSSSHRLVLKSIERPKDGWKWSGSFN